MKLLVRLVPFAVLAVLLAASAPPWPDDWDGLGFLASMARFDMDSFAPHPPGYPVYVAMLRAAHAVLRDPIDAASAVAILSGVAAVALAADAVRRVFGARAGWMAGVAVAATPLAWRAMSAIGSEAPALAFAALAAWGLAVGGRAGIVALGLGVGLGLGVRLSWAPLYLPMLLVAAKGMRLRAAGVALLACAVWAAPLVAIVGPAHLVELARAHFAGHASRWGGTVLTDPGLARLGFLGRDLFVDGLGAGADPLGIGVAIVLAMTALVALGEWKDARFAGAKDAAIVLVPYLLWIALGQNLKLQPRHALPLVVAAAVALAIAISSTTRAFTLGGALFLVMTIRSGSDAYARKTTPPPGAQLVDYVQNLPARAVVFGTYAIRYFEGTAIADRAAHAGSIGDVEVALGRMGDVPPRVLVTSEVLDRADSPYPTPELTKLCRPARIDRRAPCLTIYGYEAPYLPKPLSSPPER